MKIFASITTINTENGGRSEEFSGNMPCLITTGDSRFFPCELCFPFYRTYYPGDRMTGLMIEIPNITFRQIITQHQRIWIYEDDRLIAEGYIERIEE